MIIEWKHSRDYSIYVPSEGNEIVQLQFVPLARYMGRRAREVSSPRVQQYLLFQPGFSEYDGPVLEFIPETEVGQPTDDHFVKALSIIWERASNAARERFMNECGIAVSSEEKAEEKKVHPARTTTRRRGIPPKKRA